jgi:methyl-accepting chemotaxis protein
MSNRSVFKGLQGKLLLFFLLMSLIPLSVVSTIAYQKAKGSLQQLGNEMLADNSQKIMGKVDVIVGDRYDDIKSWAALDVIKDAFRTNEFGAANRTLAAIEKSYDMYKEILLFDTSGNCVGAGNLAIFNNPAFKRNQADREWFKHAMAGEVFTHDVYFSASINETAIGFSAPVKDDNGKIIGLIGSRIPWSKIENIVMEEGKVGETGYAYLINREGVLIAHPKKEKVLKENLAKDPNIQLASIINKMIKGETGTGFYAYEGVPKLVAYTPSKGFGDFKGVGWTCGSTIPEKELYASVYILRSIVIGVMLCAAALVALLAIVIARSIANPMLKGVAFAQAVASGDLTGQLVVTTRDEVGDLANALNNMVVSLREIVGQIRGTSGLVASAANEISAGSVQLSKAAQGQSSASEETSATMAQMAASIQTVATNADALASNADEVSASIQELGASSEQVAKSAEIMASSVSETSATIEQMTVSIEKVAQNAGDLASSVTETSATIEQMTVSIDQVAGNSQELRQVVSDSSAIIEQMAASITQVAKNVEEAAAVAKGAAKEGSAGFQAGQQAVAAMTRVAEVIEKTSNSIVNLGKRSEEIGNIVKVINEIADQTNLLALNAAIEAARAGDAGRGFAVVADEVRKLAERSMAATKEIGQVIRQVQSDTHESVKFGEIASREAEASMELTTVAGGALENIVSSIERTSNLMSDIARMTAEQATASSQVIRSVEKMNEASDVVANASREQATGGRQIRVAIERMNHITHEVTTATKEQAQGSRQIRIAVENMNHVTGQVKIATKEQALSARQIVVAVDNMNSMTQSVAIATSEQKKGGEMVVSAMENINSISRENQRSVEQLSRAAQDLSQQSEGLAAMVARFKIA